MQTALADFIEDTPEGKAADRILRSCVHCGFCTATCPTYQLLGDELDGPRGRIYLIKQVLEGARATRATQIHLDRCLTCRSCETTCPSGVRYARLADIGREVVERRVARPLRERIMRRLLRLVIPYPRRFGPLVALGRRLRPLLPATLSGAVPAVRKAPPRPAPRHPRRVLMLAGCAQSVTTPATNACAARVLDRLGVSAIEVAGAGCCGALSQHLSATEEARRFARRNIDAWWPRIEAGAEAVIAGASGCGMMLREYGVLLEGDPEYAGKAARVAAMTRDLSEVVDELDLSALGARAAGTPVAFHSPCTLQHGLGLDGKVEGMLRRLGYTLTEVPDAHLCCGSAGTYSVLQRDLSRRLRSDKLAALERGAPEIIATANVGCQLHMAAGTRLPVMHWIELLDTLAPSAD
jgi:glycolate oxidase iron-sulfur subunit